MAELAVTSGFASLDWMVLAGYLFVVVGLGAWYGRKQRSAQDYFLASHRMPMWAVSVSIVATSLSAAIFIGGPEDAYRGNLTYLSLNIGTILGVALVAIFFIPAFYRHNVTTVYELLGDRFGQSARRSSSGMFMLGRIMASGARLYMASIPFSLIVWGDLAPMHLVTAIVLVAAAATAYTLLGGIAAVIWTDVAQTVILVGAALLAIVMLMDRIPIGFGEILEILGQTPSPTGGTKVDVLDLSADPSRPYTLWSAIFGFTLFNLAAYGTDQDLAQRMLTCRSAIRGSWSVVVASMIGFVVVGIFMTVGMLLFIYYQRPDIMGAAYPVEGVDDSRQVFLEFILTGMPIGVRGLMIAGLFAAAMSSLDSALNAMASTAVCDFYKPCRPDASDRELLRVSRIAVVLWGGVLAGFACLCIWWQQASGVGLLTFALGVMIYAYGGLLGVFLTAILTRRGNSRTALAALAAGPIVVLLLQFGPGWLHAGAPDLERWLRDRAPGVRWLLDASFGWRMMWATIVCFAICVSGSRRQIVETSDDGTT